MTLRNESKQILDYVESKEGFLKHNRTIFEMLEGDVAKFLGEKLGQQLSGDSSRFAMQRQAPLNVLRKIVDKLSTLYTGSVTRTTENPNDQDLVDWYVSEMSLNGYWNDANESFNAYKTMALELYEDEAQLKTRSIAADNYLAYSNNPVDPMRMTHFMKVMEDVDGKPKYWVYTDDEFASFSQQGELIKEDMVLNEGINPFGVIPVAYQTRSRYLLTPLADTDTVSMALLIPILYTDLNFASMFLSNPIITLINGNGENIKINPNMLWEINSSDETGEKEPKIDVLRAEPNIEAQLSLIKNELSVWLQTRNIKPGAIGNLTVESAASGISLMIQEMDTTQDRKNQIPYFEQAESDYWYRLATMHNELARKGQIENRKLFSDPNKLKVTVEYPEQKLLETEKEMAERIGLLLEKGLTSKMRALREAHPKLDKDELEELAEEIKEDESIRIFDGGETTGSDDKDTESV